MEILSERKTPETQALLDSFVVYEMYPLVEPFTEKLNELIAIQLLISKDIKDNADVVFEEAQTSAYLLIVGGIFIGLFIAIFIILGINKAIAKLNTVLKEVAKGDLTIEIEKGSKDEIGELTNNLKAMVDKLKQIVGVIISGSENIVRASNETSNTSQQLSQGANEQAASAEQVSSSIEEMVANIQQNTDNAKATDEIASRSASEIEEGSHLINITVESMQTIARKISIIGEIANQTNILALNAAVEAARAGEHGKGFGVVASEVGKLAERSKIAASEIDELSKSGVEIAEQTKAILGKFVPNIEKTTSLVKEIANASVEQNAGAEQINTAIQMLNQVTQQNAASSEEMATVSEELAAQAEQLLHTISFFKINKEGLEESQKREEENPKKYLHQASSSGFNSQSDSGVNINLNSFSGMSDDDFEKF